MTPPLMAIHASDGKMSMVGQNASQCDCLHCRMERSFTDFGGGSNRKLTTRSKQNIHPSRHFKSTQRKKTSSLIDRLKPPAEVIPGRHKVPGALPVNIFPVPRNSEVATALQYYFEVFACSIHPHHEDAPEAWHATTFWTDRLQSSMADPMWFCATIAFAEAMKDRTLHDSFEKTDVVVKYQSKAFMDLRKRLVVDKDNDILLLTITVLMCIDIAFGALDSLQMHAEGLERIIQMRGGLESLNGNGYLKQKVIGFQLFWLSKQMAHATKTTAVEYPKHPFPSDLCITISKLPQDLAELALAGTLNIAMIRLTADVCAIQSKFSKEGEKRPEELRRLKLLGYEMEEMLNLRGMNQTERLVCAALCDYSTCMDSDRAQHWLLGGALRMNISGLWCRGVQWEQGRSKVLVWVGSMLAACSETGMLTWRLGTDILNRCADREVLDRELILKTCQAFVWDDVLTEKLDQKFDFCFTPSPRSITSASKSPSPSLTSSSSTSTTLSSTTVSVGSG